MKRTIIMSSQRNGMTLERFSKTGILAIFLLVILAASFLLFRLYWQVSKEGVIDSGESAVFIAEDLSDKLLQIGKNKNFTSDISIPLLNNRNVSFHVHAMQIGQFCPLHIHKDSEEATVIVKGKGKIRSITSDDSTSEIEHHVQDFIIDEGGFFYASQGNAHEFINESPDEILACLVIHSPPFRGNFYVREKNIIKSPPASYRNLISIADSMVGAGEGEVAVAEIDTLSDVEIRLMRTLFPLNENMSRGHDLVILFFHGEALLEIDDRQVKLKPTFFISIPSGTPFRIIPSKSSGDCYLLCFYLNPVTKS